MEIQPLHQETDSPWAVGLQPPGRTPLLWVVPRSPQRETDLSSDREGQPPPESVRQAIPSWGRGRILRPGMDFPLAGELQLPEMDWQLDRAAPLRFAPQRRPSR